MTAAHQLAHDVDQLGMIFHRPVNGGVEIAAIEDHEAIVEWLTGFDLAVDHGLVAGLHCGKPAERVADHRNVARAGEARDADSPPPA